MRKATSFSPCHITGFFQIFDYETDPLRVGSRGAGVSLSSGVTTTVSLKESRKNLLEIRINGSTLEADEVSRLVASRLLSRATEEGKLVTEIDHSVDLPIGSGFGTSGAAALSLALALNSALDLDMSEVDAAQAAHIAEVECGTGLGTVIAETIGGVEVRVRQGAPGIGEARQLRILRDHVVACISFGSIETSEVLANQLTRKRIDELGGKLVDALIEEPNISNLLSFSREFAEHVGLISERVRRVLRATDEAGYTCSMPMFGESVFTIIEKQRLKNLLRVFRRSGPEGREIISEIDTEGARSLR